MTNRRPAAACVEANNFGAINLMMDVVAEGFAALEAPAGGVLPAVSTAECTKNRTSDGDCTGRENEREKGRYKNIISR